MNNVCTLARAPGGQMRGAAKQAMRGHSRGAATTRMPFWLPAPRPADKARATRIPAVCKERATQPAGLGAGSKVHRLFFDRPLWLAHSHLQQLGDRNETVPLGLEG